VVRCISRFLRLGDLSEWPFYSPDSIRFMQLTLCSNLWTLTSYSGFILFACGCLEFWWTGFSVRIAKYKADKQQCYALSSLTISWKRCTANLLSQSCTKLQDGFNSKKDSRLLLIAHGPVIGAEGGRIIIAENKPEPHLKDDKNLRPAEALRSSFETELKKNNGPSERPWIIVAWKSTHRAAKHEFLKDSRWLRALVGVGKRDSLCPWPV